MKITFLNPSGALGGAETALLSILSTLREAQPNWQLHLIASADGPCVTRAQEIGVATTVLPFPQSIAELGDASAGGPAGKRIERRELVHRLICISPEAHRYSKRLRTLLARIAPDVVHTNGLKMHVLGALAKPRKASLVWHVHDYVSARPLMPHMLKLLAHRCSIALTNSQSVAADLREVCGERLPIRTIYNAIDTKLFAPHGDRLDLDHLSGLPHVNGSTVRVGMLATLARWKGHETFLRAFSYLPPHLPLRGYIIGGALYQTTGSQYSLEELKSLAQSLGVADRFGFTGFVDKPASAMRSLDIVVHASIKPEPFGMVIAEGLACGRPMIVSCAGGAAELIDENVNALAHRPNDAIGLAKCLEELASSAPLRARLGAAGRATAEERFDRSRLAGELVPIYKELRTESLTRGMKSSRS